MISSPYEIVQLNVQDGVEDWTKPMVVHGNLVGHWIGETVFPVTLASGNTLAFALDGTVANAALHVNADDGTVPMVVQEGGYEWVPVYSRKLV